MSRGVILGYDVHVPAYRLGPDAGVRGRRVVASFDEDSTTMAVAAAGSLLRRADGAPVPHLLLATTSPAYLDKTNAAAVHAALRLPPGVPAADLVGSARSTFAALRLALAAGGLVAAADVRVGRSGSADEASGADAGAAVLLAPDGDGLADVLALASSTAEVLDRWRAAHTPIAASWEERFGFERYVPLARETLTRALEEAGLSEVDHLVVTSPNQALRKKPGAVGAGAASTTAGPLGFAGAVDPLLGLADALDRAEPGDTIALVCLVDGCDVLIVRATDRLPLERPPIALAARAAAGLPVPYPTYLSWRGQLQRELPRRPEPDRPAGPPSARMVQWKFGFVGGRCRACGFAHLPPVRVCRSCGSTDAMDDLPAAQSRGTVATFTVDRLAFSPSPPVIDVVVDLDGGGRCALEVADGRPDDLAVGSRVELTFRRLFTAGEVHNYFWKARQIAGEGSTS